MGSHCASLCNLKFLVLEFHLRKDGSLCPRVKVQNFPSEGYMHDVNYLYKLVRGSFLGEHLGPLRGPLAWSLGSRTKICVGILDTHFHPNAILQISSEQLYYTLVQLDSLTDVLIVL